MVLMAGATAAVGFLPGYAIIGVLAPITLLGLRATQGLAAGGELGVAGVLIFERAPSRQRGRFSSWHTATLALGLGVGMVVAAVLLAAQRSDPLEIGWWRLAFVLALPLGLVARLVRRRVNETSQFLAVQESGQMITRPIRTLWANDRAAVLRGFALIAAGSLAFNTFFIFMPNHLAAARHLDLALRLLHRRERRWALWRLQPWRLAGSPMLSDDVQSPGWSSLLLAVLAIPMSMVASRSQLRTAAGSACCWWRAGWRTAGPDGWRALSRRRSDRQECR